MSCQNSEEFGLTQELATRIWWQAKRVVGLENEGMFFDPREEQVKRRAALTVFIEIALGHPYYASAKEIMFYSGASSNIVFATKKAWLRKQRQERNEIEWTFKSSRSQS